MEKKSSGTTFSEQEIAILGRTLSHTIERLQRRRGHQWVFLIIGLAVGVVLSLMYGYFGVNRSRQPKVVERFVIPKYEPVLEELRRVQEKLDKLESDIAAIKDAPKEKKARPVVPPAVSQESDPASEQKALDLSRYRVCIHYGNPDDRRSAQRLRQDLRDKGYRVDAAAPVSLQENEVRYFHPEDRDAAEKLKAHVDAFMEVLNRDGYMELKVRDLSKLYPGASEKLFELWL